MIRLGVASAIVDGQLMPGDIAIDNGNVVEVGLPPVGHRIAIPGLIDLQVNGWAGVDFLQAPTPDGYARAGKALAACGITAYQPTLITADEETLTGATAAAGAAMAATPPGAAEIVGVHLEGPFLSPSRLGIHPGQAVREPDATYAKRLISAGPVRTVTIAPERRGALSLIRELSEQGIVVQIGHSDATAEQARDGFDAGASAITHIFNAMRPLHHRDPGIVGAATTHPHATIQMIADGVHLAPQTAALILAACADRVVLVSDAISAAAAPEGRYTAGGHTVELKDGVPRLADGTLAGGMSTLLQQVSAIVEAGLLALDRAVNLASLHPARLVGRADLGVISVGRPANILVLEDDLRLARVLVRGSEIEPRSCQ